MWNRVYQMFRHTSCYYLPYPVLLTLIHLAPILRALPVPQKPQISKKNLNLILRNYFERTIYQVNNPLLYRAQDFPQCFCETKQILERIIVNKISYKKKNWRRVDQGQSDELTKAKYSVIINSSTGHGCGSGPVRSVALKGPGSWSVKCLRIRIQAPSNNGTKKPCHNYVAILSFRAHQFHFHSIPFKSS